MRSKWPHINEEIALRKILTSSEVKELRNLVAPSYKIKCKLENQVKKAVFKLGGGDELDCT